MTALAVDQLIMSNVRARANTRAISAKSEFGLLGPVNLVDVSIWDSGILDIVAGAVVTPGTETIRTER